MECQEFLARYSEYLDGRTSGETRKQIEAHEAACSRCRGYGRIVRAGAEILRNLPSLEVPPDFHRRLEHRIFHLEDGPSIARQSWGTGATSLAVLLLAAVMALSAWAPRWGRSVPEVSLPAVRVAGPVAASPTPARTLAPPTPRITLFPVRRFQEGMWADPHRLLREYSPLTHHDRFRTLARAGIE